MIDDAALNLAENSNVGTNVYNVNDSVTGTDQDPDGDTITYAITAGNGLGAFAIDSTTGQISVASSTPLDIETNPSFALTVQASAGGDTNTATITINLTDVDESSAVVTGTFTGEVDEGDIGDVETTTGTISISDADLSDSPSFSDVALTTGDNGYGSFELTSGTWTYTLDQNAVQDRDALETVTDTITYTATDGTTQQITVTINGTDDDSTVTGLVTGDVLEGNIGDAPVTTTGTVSISDIDGDDSPLFSDVTSTPGDNGFGSFELSSGTWTYTLDQVAVQQLDQNDEVTDTITFTATDGKTQEITVTITGTDDSPVVSGTVTGGVFEGDIGDAPVTASGSITISDADEDSTPTFSDVASTTGSNGYGSFVLSSGTWTYTLDQNAVQDLDQGEIVNDSIIYTASNGIAQQVTVNITGTNDAPSVTASSSISVVEGSSTVTTVGSSDVDADDTRSFSLAGADKDLFAIDGSGNLTFIAPPDFENPTDDNGDNDYEITVIVTDSQSETDTQAITVTVTNTDEGSPSATDDSNTATEGGVPANGNVLDNDGGSDLPLNVSAAVDGNGDSITIGTAFTTDAGGSLTINSNGSYSYAPPGQGTVPLGGLTETFDYTVSDTNGDTAVGTLTITVSNVNDAPVAIDDSLGNFDEDTNGSVDVLTGAGSDTDSDGDALSVTQVDGQAIAAGGSSVTVTNGTVSLLADGKTLQFVPVADFTGGVSFDYTVSDGALSDTGTVTGTVDPVNDDPVAVDDVLGSFNEDSSASVDVIDGAGADSDIDGDTLSVTQVEGQSVTAGGASVNVSNGTVSLNIDGKTLEFTPDTNYVGPISFDYTVSDGVAADTATVTGDVLAVNDPPEITSDGGGSSATVNVDEGTSIVTTVAASDIDTPQGNLSYSIVGGDDSTAFNLDSSTGLLTFKVAPDFETPADTDGDNEYHVTVRVDDGAGGTDTQTITVAVAERDDNTPLIDDTTVVLSENTGTGTTVYNVNDAVTGTDADPDGDAITYSITGGNGLGAFAIDPATGEITVASSTPLDAETNPNFALTVQASAGGSSDTAVVTIGLSDVEEHAPVVSGTFTGGVTEGDAGDVETVSGSLSIADADVDDSPVFNDMGSTRGDNNLGEFVLAGGTWTYALDQSAVQDLDEGDPVTDTITYTATDGTSQQITVTITGTNDAPVIAGGASQSVTVSEGTSAVASISTSDVDADDTRSFSLSGTDAGDFSIDGSGNLIFAVAPDFESPVDADTDNVYSVTVTVTDSEGATDTQDITVTVSNVDEGGPTAVADSDTATEGGIDATGNVLGNDTASDTPMTVTAATDDDGDTIAIGGAFTTDAGGSLTLDTDGGYSYTPPPLSSVPEGGLTEVFNYTVSDADGDTSTSTLTIVVTGVNESPIAIDDSLGNLAEDTSASVDVIAGAGADSDPDGDSLVVSFVDGQAVTAGGPAVSVANGSVALLADGQTLSFTPDGDYSGGVSFDYTVSDGTLTYTATVSGTVDSVNDPAAVSSISISLDESDSLLSSGGTLTSADVDNADNTFVASSTAGAIGTFSIDAAGVWSFTANDPGCVKSH